MFICVCKAVSDRRIRQAVSEGAVSLRDLSRETGLGTGCGKCLLHARDVLTQALGERRPFSPHDAIAAPGLAAA